MQVCKHIQTFMFLLFVLSTSDKVFTYSCEEGKLFGSRPQYGKQKYQLFHYIVALRKLIHEKQIFSDTQN